MRKYCIDYSPQSREDLCNLAFIIIYRYKAPLTSKRFIAGLRAEINQLSNYADSMSFCTGESLAKYGTNTKRLNYLEMAVLFGIFNNTVYIHRVIAANSIKDL